MQVQIIGANRRVGVAAASGKPYDIAELSYAVPDKDGSKQENGKTLWTYTATGFRVVSMPCTMEVINGLKAVELGAWYDLTVSPMPDNPARNIVTAAAKAK